MNTFISALYIYPIKSLQGVGLERAVLGERGFQYDRHWMLVHPDGRFLTQRERPLLVRFDVQMKSSGIQVSHPDMQEELHLPFKSPLSSPKPFSTHVWDDAVMVWEEPEAYSQWFSKALGEEVLLLRFPTDGCRDVAGHAGTQVGFADSNQFMALGEASLALLNSRLAIPVPMNRFRPNIVFSGGGAHAEDKWGRIKAGEALLEGVKPCSRCKVVTIDQHTGEVGKEPLATLAQYRREANKVNFGQHLRLLAGWETALEVGMPILVMEE